MTVLNDTDSDCKFKLSDLNDETVEAVNDAAIGDKPQEPIDREVEIERLAALDPVAYDVARNDAAEKLGIRAVTLDKQVKRKRKELGLDKADGDTGQGRTLSLPEILPWHEPIEGDRIATALSATFMRYIRMSDAEADVCA
jgi:hypothetical protein